MIKINMFQAGYGDSILVQVGTIENGITNILIDCGFNYSQNILPKLKVLLKDQIINRFIITHYDSDHIQGAISFFKENGLASEPKIVKVDQVWLNTFRHLQFSKRTSKKLNYLEQQIIKALISDSSSKCKTVNEEGEIGAKQASNLGKELIRNKYVWNSDASNKAICTEHLHEVSVSKEVKLYLLSPNIKNLKKLEKEFILKLKEMRLEPNTEDIFDDAFELYSRAVHEEKVINEGVRSSSSKVINSDSIKLYSEGDTYEADKAIGNSSSIAFILEHADKKVLFLGDAHSEDIIPTLKEKYNDESLYPIFFDAIKISHHGSFKSNNPDLFKIIDSDKFLFSTNGKHPKHVHPDIETISCIINRILPEGKKNRELIFNYELEHLKELENPILKKEFNFLIKLQEEIEV